MPRLFYFGDVLKLRGGGVEREDADPALIIEKDVGSVDIAEIVRLLLKVSGHFDQNI